MFEYLNIGDIGNIKRNLPVEQLITDAVDNGEGEIGMRGVLMVDTIQNAKWVGDHGVGISCAKVIGGEALQNFVSQAIGSGDGQLEGGIVGDADAIQVAGTW